MTKWLAPLAALFLAVWLAPLAHANSITMQTGGVITSTRSFGSDSIDVSLIHPGDPWQLTFTADPDGYTASDQLLTFTNYSATVSFDGYSFNWNSNNGDVAWVTDLTSERYFLFSRQDQSLQMQLFLTSPMAYTPSAFFAENIQPGSTMDFGHSFTTYVYGNISPVPEPSTWLLFASGLGILGWGLRNRPCQAGL